MFLRRYVAPTGRVVIEGCEIRSTNLRYCAHHNFFPFRGNLVEGDVCVRGVPYENREFVYIFSHCLLKRSI